MSMKQVYEYSNYKAYLNALIFKQDKFNEDIYDELSSSIGLSKKQIVQTLYGSRHFTKEKLYYVCLHFGLKNLEAKYLIVLLALSQANNWTEIDLLCVRLEQLKHKIISRSIDEMTNIGSPEEYLDCA